MAKTTNQTVEQSEDSVPVRTEPMTVGPSEGGNAVLAAWRGLVNLAGARAKRFDITSEGVVVVDLTFDGDILGSAGTTAGQLVSDLAFRGEKLVERRLDLIELFPYVTHPANDVQPYTDSSDMTQWMVNHLKGAGEGDGSRSPEYAKKLISAYKEDHGIAAPRGRRRKIVRLDNLRELKPETMAGVPIEELTALQKTIAEAIANQQNASAETATA